MVPAPSLPDSPARRAALSVAVGLLLVVGVQLVDPASGPPGVDVPDGLDGPAADLAAAMAASERTSHVQREVRESRNAETGAWGTPHDDYARLAFEPSDRELVAAGFADAPPGPDPAWDNYLTADGAWTRLTRSGDWRLRRASSRYGDVVVFDPGALRGATVERRPGANGTVRYEVENGTAAVGSAVGESFALAGDTHVTVWVDRETGLVDRVHVVRRHGRDTAPPFRVRIDYGTYGETTVERPDGVPRFDARLLVRDLFRGPLFAPE